MRTMQEKEFSSEKIMDDFPIFLNLSEEEPLPRHQPGGHWQINLFRNANMKTGIKAGICGDPVKIDKFNWQICEKSIIISFF